MELDASALSVCFDGLEDSWLVCDVQSMREGQRNRSLRSAGENKSMGIRPIEQDAKAGETPPLLCLNHPLDDDAGHSEGGSSLWHASYCAFWLTEDPIKRTVKLNHHTSCTVHTYCVCFVWYNTPTVRWRKTCVFGGFLSYLCESDVQPWEGTPHGAHIIQCSHLLDFEVGI